MTKPKGKAPAKAKKAPWSRNTGKFAPTTSKPKAVAKPARPEPAPPAELVVLPPPPPAPSPPVLAPRQARFVEEYLVDFNGEQAAIRAGYSEKTAASQASRLLRNANIRAAIDAGRKKISARVEINQDTVLAELAKIGFSDIRKTILAVNQRGLAALDEIDDASAAAIREVSISDKGAIRVRFHDKQSALLNMGKHVGLFRDGLDVTIKEDLATRLANRRRRAMGRG